MELRHLRYFVAVAEELNFSRAADRLHMAQPPLSQQIRALEAELGLLLFERKKRPLQLTIAGQVFLTEVRQLFAQLDQAIARAQQADSGEIGRLTIGINTSIANSVLPDILRIFGDRFPDVELILQELASYQQIRDLYEQKIDVGFVHLHNLQIADKSDEALSLMPVLQESLLIVLPDCHPLADQTSVSLTALADELFIIPPPSLLPGFYSQVIKLCQQAGFSPKVRQEAAWISTILSLVAGRVGVALLPANAQNLQRTGVVYRSIQEQSLILEMVAIWRQQDNSPILHHFLEVVKIVQQSME